MSTSVTAKSSVPGRTVIDDRAIERIAAHTVAGIFMVEPRQVHVALHDHDGDLDLTVESLISVPALGDGQNLENFGGSVHERVTRADRQVLAQLAALANRQARHVRLHITGANVVARKRVT